MFSMLKRSTPQKEIGEVVTAMTGSLPQWFSSNDIYTAVENYPISNTQGKFVRTNRVYNIADYPELYAKIGSVAAQIFTPRGTQPYGGRAITYGNGLFVVGGGGTGPLIGTSTDGITWTNGNPIFIGNPWGLTYGNGYYIYGTETGFVATSTNGTSWTQATTGFTAYNGQVQSLTYGNGVYLGAQTTGSTQRSTNAITWTTVTPGGTVTGLGYGNGLYVCAIGTTLKTSTDGITWDTQVSGATSAIRSFGYGNGLYVYGGDNGSLATSTNAITWTSRSSGTTAMIRSISYGIGKFLYSGTFGALGTSTDGINWFSQYSSISANTLSTFGRNSFVYVGFGSEIGTSANLTPEYSTRYDVSTQFYVPPFTAGSRNYTLPNYASNTSPVYVTYVRAK